MTDSPQNTEEVREVGTWMSLNNEMKSPIGWPLARPKEMEKGKWNRIKLHKMSEKMKESIDILFMSGIIMPKN